MKNHLRTLKYLSISSLLILVMGCNGFPFFFGGQSAEANKDKRETHSNYQMGKNKFAGGITPMEAAQADAVRLKAMAAAEGLHTKIRELEDDLRDRDSLATVWRDRIYAIIVIGLLLAIVCPSAVVWFWRKLKVSTNTFKHEMDAKNEEHKNDLRKGEFK